MSMSVKNKVWVADILLILVAAIWGSSYSLAKEALVFYSVIGFLFIRFFLTFIFLFPSLAVDYFKNKDRSKQTLKAGLPLGIILLFIFLFETFGVFYTTASNAAFLISLCVIFTPFVEWSILKKRPKNSIFLYSAMSLIGACLLMLQASFKPNLGDLLILCAAVSRALMVTMTKKLTINKAISMLNLTAIQSGVVMIGCLIVGLTMGIDLNTIPTEFVFWRNMLYLVLFCTIFAFFVQNYAVKIGSPSRASILMGTEPLFGAIFAAIWLSETITLTSWIGGGLIALSSVLLIAKRQKYKAED